ncbi:hypothetical protein HPB49_025195 [Dermacentor silvarum]|uniref:Uncharacterized protein n=1 Tax=Dermacentor silvarum TaxID=543639 RepID=A0ACB8C6B4_DERSI|nr:hypothetical protein HPB49_025195 [Dermacentor silvarum]
MASVLRLLVLLVCGLGPAVRALEPREVFTNSFLVRLRGDHEPRAAEAVAKRNGFHSIGPVSVRSAACRSNARRDPPLANASVPKHSRARPGAAGAPTAGVL